MGRSVEDMVTVVPISQPQQVESARLAVLGDDLPGALWSDDYIFLPEQLIASVLAAVDAVPIGLHCYGARYGGQYFELRSLDLWTPQLRALWPSVSYALFARAQHLHLVLERLRTPVQQVHGSLLDPMEERVAQMTLP